MAAKWHNQASRLNQALARNITQHIKRQNDNTKNRVQHWRV